MYAVTTAIAMSFIALGTLYFLIPVVIDRYLSYRRVGRPRALRCPMADAKARVEFKGGFWRRLTAVIGIADRGSAVSACSLWPRYARCGQRCTKAG